MTAEPPKYGLPYAGRSFVFLPQTGPAHADRQGWNGRQQSRAVPKIRKRATAGSVAVGNGGLSANTAGTPTWENTVMVVGPRYYLAFHATAVRRRKVDSSLEQEDKLVLLEDCIVPFEGGAQRDHRVRESRTENRSYTGRKMKRVLVMDFRNGVPDLSPVF